MNIFYCPYCSLEFQFDKKVSDSSLVCVICGDPLIKKTFIKPTQVIAAIAILPFIAPFIIIVSTLINSEKDPKQRELKSPIASLTQN